MTARIEWRSKGKGEDALLYVREFGEAGDTVIKSWIADAGLISDFLNDMERLSAPVERLESNVDQRDPGQWGELVLARAHEGGDILAINPEIYWDKVYELFRRRGTDPHPWHHAAAVARES